MPPPAAGAGRRSHPPLRKVTISTPPRAAHRARGNDLIMSQCSRTLREGRPDAALAEAIRGGSTALDRMQQNEGRLDPHVVKCGGLRNRCELSSEWRLPAPPGAPPIPRRPRAPSDGGGAR